MDDLGTIKKLASVIESQFELEKLEYCHDGEYNSIANRYSRRLMRAYRDGAKRYPVWNESSEAEKIKNLQEKLLAASRLFNSLHPMIRDEANSEYEKEMERQSKLRTENGVIMVEYRDPDAPSIDSRELRNRFLGLEVDLTSRGNIFECALRRVSNEHTVRNAQSLEKWKKIALLDAARWIWEDQVGQPAPVSVNDSGSEFGKFIDNIFCAMGIRANVRATLQSWRNVQ